MNTTINPLTWLTLAQEITSANAVANTNNTDIITASNITQQAEDNRFVFVQNVLKSLSQLGLDISSIKVGELSSDKQINNQASDKLNKFIYDLYQYVSKRTDLTQITVVNDASQADGFILSDYAVINDAESISIISVISLFAKNPSDSNNWLAAITKNGINIHVVIPDDVSVGVPSSSVNTFSANTTDPTPANSPWLPETTAVVTIDPSDTSDTTDAVPAPMPLMTSPIDLDSDSQLSSDKVDMPNANPLISSDLPATNDPVLSQIAEGQYNDFNSNLHNLINLLNNSPEVGSTLQSDFAALVEMLGGKDVSLQDFLKQMASNTQNDSSQPNSLGTFFQAVA